MVLDMTRSEFNASEFIVQVFQFVKVVISVIRSRRGPFHVAGCRFSINMIVHSTLFTARRLKAFHKIKTKRSKND